MQGERELVKDCRSLARFDLKDIDPMPAGMARIEVRFLIDANGILNVTARDVRTGKEQSVDVKPSYGLTDEQVEAMILESYEKAEEDFRERQVREARVEADAILAATEKAKRTTPGSTLPKRSAPAVDRAQRAAGGLSLGRSPADPRPDRRAEPGHHEAGREHDEHGRPRRAERNQDLMPAYLGRCRRYRNRAVREVPRHGSAKSASPICTSGSLDSRTSPTTRRNPTRAKLEAIQMAWYEEWKDNQ